MTPLLLTLGLATQAGPASDPRYPVQYPVYAPPRYAPPLYAPPFYGRPIPPIVVVPPRPAAVSVEEFARCFRPSAGRHEIWVIHPYTRRPVEVCFTLPHGRPDVDFTRRHVEFDYGRKEVDIRFLANGSVDVQYDR